MMEKVKEKNIVLIGFMGAGKTTAGELAAEKLNRQFVDIDLEIENEFGMPASEIFKKHGESVFRSFEKNIIETKCKDEGQVISLGGGAFINEETRKTCLANTVVVFLDISWEAWKKRYELLVDTRPVLQGRDLKEIKELFTVRRALYGNHHFKVRMDGLSPDEAADEIVEVYLKTTASGE